MTERRSARSCKQVNYAKFEDELDDDFEDLTPPNKKQKKTDVREGAQKEKKREDKTVTHSVDIELIKTPAKTKRKPVEEQMYERDMQAALQLSLLSTSQNGSSTSKPICHSTPLRAEASFRKDEKLDEAKDKERQSAIPLSGAFGVPCTDEIEFLGTVVCNDAKSTKGRRQAAEREKNYLEDDGDGSDEDFRAREEASTDDSDCNESGSDFDDGTSRNRKTKAKLKTKRSKKTISMGKSTSKACGRQSKKCEINSQHHPVSVPCREHETVAAVTSTQSPSKMLQASFSGGRAAVSRKPAWAPPGLNDGTMVPNSMGLKSPSSGLRLGLSRHARIKSLHPSLKVS